MSTARVLFQKNLQRFFRETYPDKGFRVTQWSYFWEHMGL